MLLALLAVSASHAGEIERFWHDFPGFRNTLSSYGYDRGFAIDARPEFVDEVVRDTAKKPSKQRMNEYACVLFYMDSKVVSERLATFDSSSSPAIRRAVATIRQRFKDYEEELKQKHK